MRMIVDAFKDTLELGLEKPKQVVVCSSIAPLYRNRDPCDGVPAGAPSGVSGGPTRAPVIAPMCVCAAFDRRLGANA